MNFNKLVLSTLLFLVSLTAFAQDVSQSIASVDPHKAAVIRELLKTTGSINLGKQVMSQIAESMKEGRPEATRQRIDRMMTKMDPNELVDSIVVLYDRHLSTADVEGMLAFYKSPVGQKLIKELPSLMSEAMQLGKEWGERKAAEFQKEIEQEQDAQEDNADDTQPKISR